MVRKIWCVPVRCVSALPRSSAILTCGRAAAHDSCIGAGYVGGPTMAMIALKWCVRGATRPSAAPASAARCTQPQLGSERSGGATHFRACAVAAPICVGRARARLQAARAKSPLRRCPRGPSCPRRREAARAGSGVARIAAAAASGGLPTHRGAARGPRAAAAVATGLLPAPEAAAPRSRADALPRCAPAAPTSRCVRGRLPAARAAGVDRSLGPRGLTRRLPVQVVVVDISQPRIDAWNSAKLPIYEPRLDEVVFAARCVPRGGAEHNDMGGAGQPISARRAPWRCTRCRDRQASALRRGSDALPHSAAAASSAAAAPLLPPAPFCCHPRCGR